MATSKESVMNEMAPIRKKIVTDELQRPIAVQIEYQDWLLIEDALRELCTTRLVTDLSRHIGTLDWPVDGVDYQNQIRGEWN